MTGFETFWAQGDAITRGVALLLLISLSHIDRISTFIYYQF